MARRSGGFWYMLTLTAPGDREHWNSVAGEVCPCTPAGGIDLARWNASHSRRWNHFRTALRQAVPDLRFLRGVEVQQRGALHDHAIIWSPVALNVADLRQIAIRAGFGHSLDLAWCEPGSKRAAYYVSKYVTKASDQREEVPWWGDTVDPRTGELAEGVIPGRYRTWSSSRDWGITMAQIRAARAEAARVRAAAREDAFCELIAAEFGAVVLAADDGPPI